jgi:hypothetical protein
MVNQWKNLIGLTKIERYYSFTKSEKNTIKEVHTIHSEQYYREHADGWEICMNCTVKSLTNNLNKILGTKLDRNPDERIQSNDNYLLRSSKFKRLEFDKWNIVLLGFIIDSLIRNDRFRYEKSFLERCSIETIIQCKITFWLDQQNAKNKNVSMYDMMIIRISWKWLKYLFILLNISLLWLAFEERIHLLR